MKRYRFKLLANPSGMYKHPEGEWVRYDDVNRRHGWDRWIIPRGYWRESTKSYRAFCNDCKHLGCQWADGYGCGEATYLCHHPANTRDTWHKPNTKYALAPQELNRNNDCKYFEDKKSKGGD